MAATGLPPFKLCISIFKNAMDNRPKPLEMEWSRLSKRLTSFPISDVQDKRLLPAWSPALFHTGASRKANAVVELSCLVLDLDDPPFNPAPWEQWLYVCHSTWSHTSEEPRQRLVLPLAHPVPAACWASAWAWAHRQEPRLDAHCRDAGRMYFLPAIASPEQSHFSVIHMGETLDLLPICEEEVRPTPVPIRRLKVPWNLRQKVAERRLKQDPLTHEMLAESLRAHIRGEGRSRRAEHISCPACGRPSVWYVIAPERQWKACCNHKNSCGWRGTLTELGGEG